MAITWEQLAWHMRDMAEQKSEWAGLPMPLPDHKLVLESKFPYQFGQFGPPDEPVDPEYEGAKEVNRWWSNRYGCYISIFRLKDGKLLWGKQLWNRATMLLETLGASLAWQPQVELTALGKLESMIPAHAMKHYLMTGSFLESSKRSNITYMFRRLRPTLAISSTNGKVRVLCGLCMHSVGYYAGTWAGVLTPTDDVISHLVFMRGDEHAFWKNCNQHEADQPQSGL